MDCNINIHDELISCGEISCPFCDKILDCNKKPKDDLCCDMRDIINDNGMLVCRICGVVQGYNYVKEYVDFYENRHKFKRKSVYHREYHINNTIIDIEQKYNIKISYHDKRKIERVFAEIGNIIDQVNGNRKRMISVNYIMRMIFKMMGIPYKKIPISKSKKTLAFYNKYWASIMSLIGDKIKSIIG